MSFSGSFCIRDKDGKVIKRRDGTFDTAVELWQFHERCQTPLVTKRNKNRGKKKKGKKSDASSSSGS